VPPSSILSYVFWHEPRRTTPRAKYERELLAFQGSLRAHPPPGLVDILSFRETGSPWSKHRRTTYEDWYLAKGFRSIGLLNQAAVEGANKGPHDDVARDGAAVAGGLYKLLRSSLPLRDARSALWLEKPDGMSYRAFLGGLSELTNDDPADVWQRQMVLGPAPEFCIHSRAPLRPQGRLEHLLMSIRPIGDGRA
jgi:hypothetical protein